MELLVVSYNKFFHPKRYADYLYKKTFGYGINWHNPRNLNEWINYFSFKTDTHEWSRLTDKLAVREYVSNKGLESILIPLYGIWENVDNIDFDLLPDSFAIKTNHACGNTFLVLDKATAEINLIKEKLRESLSSSYGRESAEPHYFRIKPKVFAEQLLPPPTNIDYKIWCFYGHPECIMTMSNRERGSGKFRLSEGFPEVRVDFYHTHSGIFFGELTFTAAAGRMVSLSEEYLTHCGEIIKYYLHSGMEKDNVTL